MQSAVRPWIVRTDIINILTSHMYTVRTYFLTVRKLVQNFKNVNTSQPVSI